MACNKRKDEIIVCNVLFEYDLTNVNEDTYNLNVTPCNNPTAYFNVARITTRENQCNQMSYYQALINTDPVVIIQDCSLENIIRRCIVDYFNGLQPINLNCNNGNYRRCCSLF